jgi:hypothetical protein
MSLADDEEEKVSMSKNDVIAPGGNTSKPFVPQRVGDTEQEVPSSLVSNEGLLDKVLTQKRKGSGSPQNTEPKFESRESSYRNSVFEQNL